MGAAGSMPGTLQLSSGNQPLWPRYKYGTISASLLTPAAAGGHTTGPM